MYTRKELRAITGLPDKTLRWLLEKLEIEPVDIDYTLFGSPIFIYADSALDSLHDYIFKREQQKAEYAKGKRCRGGCNRYLPDIALNSQQICDHCRRQAWILNEVYHNDRVSNNADTSVIRDIETILKQIE